MSMVAFFPWFDVEEVADFGEFALIPYQRRRMPARLDSTTPAPVLQANLDRIIAPFYAHHGVQINLATILRIGTHALTDDLDENEQATAFLIAELIAFGGLAARSGFRKF
jgi:hypothetical protein